MFRQRTLLTYENALSRAAALCAKCEQCTPDLMKKLLNWGVKLSDASKIISKLIELNFVDDIRFSKAYAHDKLNFSGWGRRKIQQGLWAKRLPASVIEVSCDEIDEDEYKRIALKVMKSKARSMKEWPLNRENKLKLIKYVMQRGFEYPLIADLMRGGEYKPDNYE